MIRAWFDDDGFLTSALRGGSKMVDNQEADGRKVVDLPDDADINHLFYDPVHGPVTPATRAIAFDRSMLAVGETTMIAGLPDPAFLIVNGARRKVAGGTFRWTPTTPGTLVVALTGPICSPEVTAMADTLPAVETMLLARVDARRELLLAAAITRGDAINNVYSRKAQEVSRASGILPATLNALLPVERKAKYPFAHAESVRSGDSLAVVLARFAGGVSGSDSMQPAIEAIAQGGKRAIKAAGSSAAKLAAFNAIAWSA